MPYGSKRHRRRSIRLKGYDDTRPEAYFVTICTHDRKTLFGRVVDGDIVLNAFGEIVWEERFRTAQLRPYVALFEHEFVVMPNHIHGIIWIVDDVDDPVGAQRRCAPTHAYTCKIPTQQRGRGAKLCPITLSPTPGSAA